MKSWKHKEPGISPVDLWIAQKIGVRSEELTQEKLEEYQIEEIRKLLYYLKENSTFYRKQLEGFDIEGLMTCKDLQSLPYTQEEDLLENAWMFQCIPSDSVPRVVSVESSGTTGRKKRFCYSAEDIAHSVAFVPVGFAQMCDPGDKVLVLMSGPAAGGIGAMLAEGLKEFGICVKTYGALEDLQKAAEEITAFCPDVIVAAPRQIALLEGYLRSRSILFETQSVLLSADSISDALCKRIETAWNCKVFRHYGMTELCMFGAVECAESNGYHMRSADHFFEITDPDADGFGQIAVTTFHHTAMPLLRYRTGDIGRMINEPCSCGSRLARIETIKGRKAHFLPGMKEQKYLSDLEEILFSNLKVVDYQLEEEKDGLVLKLYYFGEMPDGGEIKRGIIPLFQPDRKPLQIRFCRADVRLDKNEMKRRVIRT